MRAFVTHVIDYATLPVFLGCAVAAVLGAQRAGLEPEIITFVALAPLILIALVWERVRPEREDFRRLDLPWYEEVGHFLLGTEAGAIVGGLAAMGASWLSTRLHAPFWPSHWPMALQVLLALFLGEAVAYWEHRLGHRTRWLWRFHAIHHSGSRLNFARTGRFHFIDVTLATFATYLGVALLGGPPLVFTWLAVMSGALGLIEHANIRLRTPWWLDRLICTPAVHRWHHSLKLKDSDGNFATTFMIFDMIFGSYIKPEGPMPPEVGIEDDPVPRPFWRQMLGAKLAPETAEPEKAHA